MSKFQRTAVAGEVSPSVITRFDTAKLTQALKTCRNFQILRQGQAGNRPGMMHVGVAKAGAGIFLMRGFVFNNSQAYALEIGHLAGSGGYIRVILDGAYVEPTPIGNWSAASVYVPGAVVTGSDGLEYIALTDVPAVAANNPTTDPEFHWHVLTNGAGGMGMLELPTPYGASLADPDTSRISLSQSGDVVTFTVPNGNIQVYELTRLTADKWTFLPQSMKPSDTGPAAPVISTAFTSPGSGVFFHRWKVTSVDKDGRESVAATADEGGGPYFTNTVAGATFPSFPSYVTGDLEVAHTGHPFIDGDEIAITGVTFAGNVVFQNAVIALEDTTWFVTSTGANTFTLDGSASLFNQDATRLALNSLIYPAFDLTYDYAYWQIRTGSKDIAAGHDFAWSAVTGANEYFVYYSRDAGKYEFVGSTKLLVWENDATPDKLPQPDIILIPYGNPFTIDGSAPAASAYHDQRQVFAGTANVPDRVRFSKIGNFKVYGDDPGVTVDSDPMFFDVAPEEAIPIRSVVSLGQLIVFTSESIRVFLGDASGAITPSEPNVRSISSEGAANIQPLLADDRVLYIEPRQTYVRELRFDLANGGFQGYSGRELGEWATHLLVGYTIVDWAYSRIPDPTVWLVRSDGVLLGITYIPKEEILAWHRHDTGGLNDKALTVAVIPENNQDVLYLGVERVVNGATVYHTQRMIPRKSGNEPDYDQRRDAVFVDDFLTYDGTNTASAATMVLTHTGSPTWLEGDTGYTLTASGGTPFPGTGSNAANGYRLVSAAGDEVEVIVTVDGSTSVQTVALLTDAPTFFQGGGASTTSWILMIDDILSGLIHLETETVSVLADGHVLAQVVVNGSGGIPRLKDFDDGVTDRPYGMVHVGLPITAEIETLDFDFVGRGETIADKFKATNSVTLYMENTRGVKAGQDASHLFDFEPAIGETDFSLVTDKRLVRTDAVFNRNGRIVIRQTDPLPVSILGMILNTRIEGR